MASGTITKYADGTDSGWKELTNSTDFNGTLYYRRIGDIFILKNTGWISLKTALVAGGQKVLATIPATDNPGVVIGYAMVNNSVKNLVTIKIESRNVSVCNSTSGSIAANEGMLINVITVIK